MHPPPQQSPGAAPPPRPAGELSFRAAVGLWWRIGWTSFGGPAAHIANMHRELIEKRGLLDEARFLRALNFCMLLPGPEAQQLATYLGWLLHGVRGGLAAGILFVAPGALVMALLSILYVELGDLKAVAGLFFGLKAAVLALVVLALKRIAARALGRRGAKTLAVCAFVALFALRLPFPLVLAAAGVWGALASRGGLRTEPQPARTSAEIRAARAARRAACLALALWLLPSLGLPLALGPEHVLAEQARFFSGAALVTFGGAYAVLSYISTAAVERFQWLTTPQMVDGLGLAETTPGPLILVVQFVGFVAAYQQPSGLPPLLAGLLGAAVTLWVTFAPSFLWIFLGAPAIERLTGRPRLEGALAAITSAVVGVIANLFLTFGLHVLFGELTTRYFGPLSLPVPAWSSLDPYALGLAVAAALALLRGVHLGWVLSAAAGLGALARLAL